MAGKSKWLTDANAEPELDEQKSAAMELIKSIRTTPRSKKHPAQNQGPHCWNRYNDWVMCLKTTNDDKEGCKQMRQMMLSICPYIWYEKWDEDREDGKFAGIKTGEQAAAGHH